MHAYVQIIGADMHAYVQIIGDHLPTCTTTALANEAT